MLLFLYAALVAVSTAVLIFAGGMVTSNAAGLSVPDWPTTYGWFMFSFPADKWVGGIFYEHTHRLIASTVGLLIVGLAIWLWRAEPRRWVRNLGYLALAAVVTQGILGGITVLWYLPDPISIAHASLAEIVFCLTVSIALVESPGWKRAYAGHPVAGRPSSTRREAPRDGGPTSAPDDRVLQKLTIATVVMIYIQILMGATMRHTNAGLAIPDFPLAFGHLVPPHWDPRIAIHFAHRVGALFVTVFLMATTGHIFYHHRDRRELVRPSILLLVLLAVQITLGGLTVLSGKQPVINSFHVVTGASVFVTAVVLALRSHRARFADAYVGRVSPEADPPGLRGPGASAQNPAYVRRAGPLGPAEPNSGARA